jgi:hypothetical protein
LKYFVDIGDILWPLGTFCVSLVHFFPVLVSCTNENLATLPSGKKRCKKREKQVSRTMSSERGKKNLLKLSTFLGPSAHRRGRWLIEGYSKRVTWPTGGLNLGSVTRNLYLTYHLASPVRPDALDCPTLLFTIVLHFHWTNSIQNY